MEFRNSIGLKYESNRTKSVNSDADAFDLTYSYVGQSLGLDFGIQCASDRQSFFGFASYRLFDGYHGWFGPCNFSEFENFSDVSIRQNWFAGASGCLYINDVCSFMGSTLGGIRISSFKHLSLKPVLKRDLAGDFSFNFRPWYYKNDVEFSAGVSSWEMFWHPVFGAPVFYLSVSGTAGEKLRLKALVGMRTFDYFGISAADEGATIKIGAEVLF